jgi:hypothetical protein
MRMIDGTSTKQTHAAQMYPPSAIAPTRRGRSPRVRREVAPPNQHVMSSVREPWGGGAAAQSFFFLYIR